MKKTRTLPVMISSRAEITTDLRHRYLLQRTWDESLPSVMFIGLNPSRADHTFNDPTITRCINFAVDWGYGTLFFANLYSFRTPYVTDKQARDAKKVEATIFGSAQQQFESLLANLEFAVGPECDAHLGLMITAASKVIVAWGSWPFIEKRKLQVLDLIKYWGKYPSCLGLNKDGSPKHPLYLHSLTMPMGYPSWV